MGRLMVISVSATKVEKKRSDKKVSREYVTVSFADKDNPFTLQAKRNFFQQHSPDGSSAFWKGLQPEQFAAIKEVEGEIMRAEVEEYEIANADGSTRKAGSYTCALLKGEYLPSILAQAGHTPKGQIVAKEAAPGIMSTQDSLLK